MKVVYNNCYGGFGLSTAGLKRYAELKGSPIRQFDDLRDDPLLVQVVEELGETANGPCALLAIHDVPAGARWRIDEYDGAESVMTVEDYDWKVAS